MVIAVLFVSITITLTEEQRNVKSASAFHPARHAICKDNAPNAPLRNFILTMGDASHARLRTITVLLAMIRQANAQFVTISIILLMESASFAQKFWKDALSALLSKAAQPVRQIHMCLMLHPIFAANVQPSILIANSAITQNVRNAQTLASYKTMLANPVQSTNKVVQNVIRMALTLSVIPV